MLQPCYKLHNQLCVLQYIVRLHISAVAYCIQSNNPSPAAVAVVVLTIVVLTICCSGNYYSVNYCSGSNWHSDARAIHKFHRNNSVNKLIVWMVAYLSCSNFSTLSISSLCLVLGFGGSNGQVNIASFTSFSSFGIWGWLKSLSNTIPWMNHIDTQVNQCWKRALTFDISYNTTTRPTLIPVTHY